MKLKTKTTTTNKALLRIRNVNEKGCASTVVRINRHVEVGTRDGYVCFWVAGREVRVGPLSAEQAEKLSEDLGYDAVV
jgi:hypothetical protein